ncbi:MAG: peptidylprolyl isomerase [Planctomycetia bacterium]|nr:peptidylprolyl isomerase [Planctomycetia bacterium]
MAARGTWRKLTVLPLVMLASAAFIGCGKQEGAPAQVEAAPAPAAGDTTAAVVQAAKAEVRLHQTFEEATIADQPDQYLPDKTLGGKSVGKLYEQVVKRWNHVSFLTGKGDQLVYTATIDTELGSIDIDLFPEQAPNHVRNFVALAQCGYFDGLVFERTLSEQAEEDPNNRVELIEGGCPVGTGNPGFGSIGYWLKPEFSEALKHEEGMVGACRGEDPDTAACRFYVTLSKAPVMDGERTIFGKVTRGLDVVRRIATQPVLNTPDYPLGDRPQKPVVIRKVTVKVRPAGTVSAPAPEAKAGDTKKP